MENEQVGGFSKKPSKIIYLIGLLVLIGIGGILYWNFVGGSKKTATTNKTTSEQKEATSSSNQAILNDKTRIDGVVQKLEFATDKKTGVLSVSLGTSTDATVYQVRVDDSTVVSKVSPPKTKDGKAVASRIKWQDIKVNEYVNVILKKERDSGAEITADQVKAIGVIRP